MVNIKNIFLIMIIVLTIFAVNALILDSSFAKATASTTASHDIAIGIVNQDPDPAIAGNTFDIRISAENNGYSATDNVILEIVPSYPFEAVEGESLVQNIGTLGAFQSGSDNKIAKYTLKVNRDATQGTYDLTVKYYLEGQNVSVTKTLSVNVRGSQSVEIIHIDKTILIPGKQSSLKFVITNAGTSPLRDLTFSWTNDGKVILPVGSDNTRYISYLDVGKSAELEYQVIADTTVTAGLYPLDLVLKYGGGSSSVVTTLSTIAGVYVGGETDFDVAFSDSSTTGTSFTIANIGSNPATSVSISIPQQKGWKVTGSNAIIIGNLNKGDYTVANFKLQSQTILANRTGVRNNYSNSASNLPTIGSADGSMGSSASSPDSLMMQIAYTDTMGIRTIVNKTIQIGMQNIIGNNQTGYGLRTATTKSTGLPSYMWYIILAVVLIAGFIIYKRYNRQRLLNPGAKIKDVFKPKKK